MGRKEKAAKFQANTSPAAAAAATKADAVDMNDDDQRKHPEKPKLGKPRTVTLRPQSTRLRSSFLKQKQGAVTRETIDVDGEPNNVEVLLNIRPEPNFSLPVPNVDGSNAEATSSQQNYEEKINYLMQSFQEFKSRMARVSIPLSAHQKPSAKLDYRNLYIQSQKMVDALINEKSELATMLDRANAKVEAYGEIWDKFIKR